ncbi:MAG: beta-lactamase family protein, partial [Tannerella sp.]|nr:beta-lactamase family protein [Tannerella sp.]
MKKIISFLTFPFISMSVVAQQNEAKMENQILTQEIENNKSPSVQYYFFKEDEIIETFQSGFADIANQKTADENTTYNAFSVTKTFTALAVL